MHMLLQLTFQPGIYRSPASAIAVPAGLPHSHKAEGSLLHFPFPLAFVVPTATVEEGGSRQ